MTGHEARSAGRRRRGRRLRLVISSMSRIGKQPIPVPAGVDVFIEPELVRVKGTRGELEERVSRDMTVEQEDGVDRRHAPDRPRRAPRAARPHPLADREHGRRASPNGFEKRLEIQGVGYRAALQRQGHRASGRLLAPGADQGAGRHRVRGAGADAGHRRAATPSRSSARSRRASARCARPSPTRARASATRGEYVQRKVGKRA